MKFKRGSHVGRVLSFVIFIVFFVYFYSLLGPEIFVDTNKDYLTDYLEEEIKNNITGSIDSRTMTIDDSQSEKCVLLMDLLDYTEEERIAVENEDGENVTLRKEKDKDNVFLLREDNDNEFFKIYSSEEFEELQEEKYPRTPPPTPAIPPFTAGGTTCNQHTPKLYEGTNYTIHTSGIKEGVLLSLFKKLKENYESDYEELKTYFNFPQANDFGFGLELENGTIIQTPEPDIKKNVYVQRMPVEYYTENTERKQGFLIIRVW